MASADTHEAVPLQVDQPCSSERSNTRVKCHRRLAIASIICGFSCIGISALIHSVKAKELRETDPEKAAVYSCKARNRSITAIVLCWTIVLLTPPLLALVSYLLRTIE